MSATHTLFGREQLLAAVYTPDVYTPPAGLWIALTLLVPGTNDDGTTIIEPDPSTGYERLSIGVGSAHWQPSGAGELTQVNSGTMPALTADTGLIVGYAVVDAAAIGAGNAYIVGDLPQPIQGTSGIALFVGGITNGLYD